jgi:hypothetical protein
LIGNWLWQARVTWAATGLLFLASDDYAMRTATAYGYNLDALFYFNVGFMKQTIYK